jgi:hypothetical protein
VVCPEKIVIQTDWWPEIEHGGSYQLIGPAGKIDKETFRYSGPIDAKYAVGGVKEVEIRAGGDAIQFAPVTTEMYTKDEITFGYVNASDAAKDSKTAAVVGVAKTLEINPQMIQWDPTQLKIEKPEDIATTGAKVLHFDGTTYMDYLVTKGYVTESQVDPSYGGAPDVWIAAGGNFIQQGFVTNEIFKYENIFEWKDGKPADVSYLLVHDLGFEDYPAMLTVRQDKLADMTPCLKAFVPMMAQAWVDYLKDPTPIADALVKINDEYDTYWKVTPELNAAGLELFTSEKIAANGPAGDYCSFDDARVQGLIDILADVFKNRGIDVAADLAAGTITDNSFCEGAASL